MAFGHQLVTRRTTLLLRGFRAEQVTKARRAAYELTGGGELEPLGNGLLGLLHGKSVRKQRSTPPLARVLCGKVELRRSGRRMCRHQHRSTAPQPVDQRLSGPGLVAD